MILELIPHIDPISAGAGFIGGAFTPAIGRKIKAAFVAIGTKIKISVGNAVMAAEAKAKIEAGKAVVAIETDASKAVAVAQAQKL